MHFMRLKTPRGYINLDLDKFFPATVQDIRKLLKAILEGYQWDRPDEGKEGVKDLIDYIKGRIDHMKEQYKHYYDMHNNSCDPKTTDFYDLMYLNKHADITAYVLNQINAGRIRLEKNLELLEKEYENL